MSGCICALVFLWWIATTSHSLGADVCQNGGKNISTTETINITSYYNSMSRSININITTDNLRHKCINVIHKKTDNQSNKDCDESYFQSYFSENSGETSTVFPEERASTHDFLQPGCSYEVYVRDENGNYAQQEFTVKDCFEELCNCKSLHPKLEITEIRQIGPSEAFIKWEEVRTNTSIKKTIFWIENENGRKLPCEKQEVDSTSALLNCSEYFAVRNYTLNAAFRDEFDCKGKKEMPFLGTDMVSDEEVITNKLLLLKQSDGRVIQVVAVYNADYNILQFNVSWSDFIEQDYVTIKIDSENQDPAGRCYINTTSILKKAIKHAQLPQKDESHALLPGCSYKISVQPVNREIIHYAIPACLQDYLGQLETPPVVTANSTFIVAKFQTDFLDNLTVKTASLFTSDFSYVCECALLKRKANKAVFSCAYPLEGDSYVISFSLVSKDGDCELQYLQTSDQISNKRFPRFAEVEDEDKEKTMLTTTNNISLSEDIIAVEAIYNKIGDDDVIQLNVTFTLEPSSADDFIHFHIAAVPNNGRNSCDNNYFYETSRNFADIKSKTTSILLPTHPTIGEIKGDCTYEIRIRDSFSYNYTVPVCVGPICNFCHNSTPQVDLKTIMQTSEHVLNATWHLDAPKYNISHVEFKYRGNETSHATHLCKVLSSTHDISITEEIYSKVECMGLVEGTTYVLIATITNSLNCTRVVSKNFTAVWFDHSQESYTHHLWIEIPAFLAILILVSLVLYYKRKVFLEKFKLSNTRNESYEIYETPADRETRKAQECYNIIYCESEILSGNVDQYEIPRTRVKIIKLLDSGAFGQVFSARILGTVDNKPLPPVAVKTLRDHAPPEEVDDFLSEIDILKRIGEHPNIVKLIGCCTLKQPYMMVMELVPCGSLKSYLLTLRKRWENYKKHDSVFLDSADGDYIQPDTPSSQASTIPSHKFPSLTETEYTNLESEGHTPLLNNFNYSLQPALDHTELQNFALQIAKGMAYLEEKQITHRDLAARNVLINEFKTLKISDFGLSRVGPYINNKTKKLPLRWMSIEAIEDHFYSNKSDVWSFGIVLWEIGSLGAIPYENTPDALILHDLLVGKRLEKPGICTDELYNLMLKCWTHDPDLRPSFAELVEQLDVKKMKIYVDFSQLNPTYVFPPSTLEKMSNAQFVTER